jgi:hypothetical protein
MSDSSPKIAPVTEDNELEHTERLRRRRLKKAFLKAKDRRKNFENGEFAGFLYCLGLLGIMVAASGQGLVGAQALLETWHRIILAFLGVFALLGKTYIKRRFWKQTEDAEYKEELEEDDAD